jgi:FKBP-type peptidyl-prolyl cis-trans isomerase FkpA
MNKTLCLLAAAFFILATGCKNQQFKKEKDGTEYKIISSGGKKATAGDFMEVNILAKYKDSVLFSSVESSMPRFIPFDTAQLPPFFKEIHEGDSLVIRQSTDSLMKTGQSAPFMEKGQFVYQTFKIVKLFSNKDAADSASKPFEALAKVKAYKKTVEQIEKDIAANAPLVKEDDKTITDFITKNNLKADKTPWGTYVAITTPGTGDKLNENSVAEINYTGKTFNDSTFDSNTDKKFNHVQPLYVDMSQFQVIPGWIDGLKMMQKGSVGKIIIPSYLAYGKNGAPPKIGPDQNLVFDIQVTDVLTYDQYQQKMEAQQKMMQMMQQQMQQQQQQQQQNPQEQKPAPKK